MIEMVHVKEISGRKKIISEHENSVRTFGAVDLGKLNWSKSTVFSANLPTLKQNGNGYCSIFPVQPSTVPVPDYDILQTRENSRVYIRYTDDSPYANMTKEEFKAAMQGVYLYFELATPVQPSGEPVVLWEAAE